MTATPQAVAPATLTKGGRFRVYGADSTGIIADINAQAVSFRYDHAPETPWGMKRADFEKIAYPIR